jgi:co-chaperonin GroES (HSP10)
MPEASALAGTAIVQRLGAFDDHATSLIVVEPDKPPIERGEVLAAAPAREDHPTDVHVGDIVIYSRYAGRDWWDHDGTDRVVLDLSEILAVVAE